MNALFLFFAVVAARPVAPDTLVVCPNEFRPALADWVSYRRAQGHEILLVEPPASAEQLRKTIRGAAQFAGLKYLVLIGDETLRDQGTGAQQRDRQRQRRTVPTNYVAAKVNVRWGSEPEIATDTPYADLDGDGVPDLAVGRIPAHSAEELAAVLRKVIRYEQSEHGSWEKSLHVVSGSGGFGAVTDAVLAAAGRQVITQTVPSIYHVTHICAGAARDGQTEIDFAVEARRQLSDGGLAWIYLGHGLPTELVCTCTANAKPLLSVEDVPRLRSSPHNPLAVLIACYTGAMDGPHDCLGEDLLLAEEGPVAVIAATRVTMPYGNTVIGYELLRSCFQDEPPTLGDMLRIAQRRVLTATANDQLRATLDSMATAFSPPPVDLASERLEHVLMYQLIGDPLLRLHRPATRVAQASAADAVTK